MQAWVEFPLTKGKVALVDVADLLILARWRWSASYAGDGLWYPRRFFRVDGKQKSVSMHRWIMQPPDGMIVDHANGNGLDNRRVNLRIATASQNNANNSKWPQATRIRRYRGVRKSGSRWGAITRINGRTHWIGSFATAEEAARAYDAAAREAFGEFAVLNFPDVNR